MKLQRGIGTGSATILVIFVALCLTTFGTLSLVSAQADLRLAERAAKTLSDYYAADYTASGLYAQLSSALGSISPAPGEERYLSLCEVRLARQIDGLTLERGDGLIGRFSVPIDERRALSVAFRVRHPQSGEALTLLEWKTVDTAEWVEQDSLNLWTGEEVSMP